MKILYLAHRIPYPPDKGDKMRAYRHLAHLASQHDVWCACFVDTPSDEQHVDALRRICRDVAAVRLNRSKALLRGAANMVRGGTITKGSYDLPAMHQALAVWRRETRFDVVVAFSSSMAPFALSVPASRHVLDMCDVDSAKWLDYANHLAGPKRWIYKIEGTRLRTRERDWAHAFDATTVITRAESDDLRALAPEAPIFVATNGVEVPDLNAVNLPRADDAYHSANHGPTIGFVGVMDYLPNVEAVTSFVDDCWWDIRSAFPTAAFRIVGRRPARVVQKLARVPGVSVVGEVDDVAAELRSFDVSVAPLNIARGLQNKILEAMAYGVPVVASEVAARGIEAKDGKDFLVARGPDRMIRHVLALLRNDDDRRHLGQAGRRFVLSKYRWPDALEKLELIVTGESRRERRREEPPTLSNARRSAEALGPL